MTGVHISYEQLTSLPLFAGLAEAEVLPLIQAAHHRERASGEFFFFQDDEAEAMFVLTHGRVKLTQVGQDGRQALLKVIKPIHLFGLVAMTPCNAYPVSAQAATESRAIFWTRAELMGHVLKTPQMALNAMRIMAEQLQEVQDRFRQVTTQRVDQRLAHTLIRLAAQSGKRVQGGILIDLDLSRKDLAEMSGTTLYTASRMLSLWQAQGLVIPGRGKVIVRNPHGLRRIVDGERLAEP
jgi:CRP-like cAMP-binding protein